MSATVTPVKVGFGPKDLGKFKIARFNMFDDDELEKYAELRNDINDASKGMKIELMREYSRKTTVREGAGADQVVTATEEIHLVIHYWQKKPKRKKGDRDEKTPKTKRDWSIARAAS